MGKRFTDTDKWKKTWFRKLSPEMKCVWDYLCSNCDAAGIWEVDEEAMSFFIGSTITLDEITSSFGDRIEKINGSKIWIVDFCGFQYGEIKENYNPHRPVIKSLEKYKLKSRVQQPFSKGC